MIVKNIELKKIFLAVMILLLFPMLGSCEKRKYNLPVENLVIEKADGSSLVVNAELAKTQEERNWGFMERKKIPEGTGMLFVFERDQLLSFWMKNTPSPLSIAYIDRNGVIVDLYDMKPFDEKSVESTRNVRFALEVPQGWYKKNGVKTGDKVIVSSGDTLFNFFFNK